MLKDLSEAEKIPYLRHLLRTDLFFLLWFGLNRTDVFNQWILDRCNEVQASPDGHLDLWSRGHYKSSVITFAKTIQDILASHGQRPVVPHELTFGIFSSTRPLAKQFLSQIKREFESNDLLKSLFPDILYSHPKRESARWSDEGIIVRRKGNPKECTVEAWGVVEGQPTSKHFDVLIYDDVVTIANVATKEMMDKTTQAWSLSLNLGAKGAKFRYIGTRYHFADTYAEMIKRDVVKARIHPAEDEQGNPVLLTKEELEIKRKEMGSYVYNAQMLLNPLPESEQNFKLEWLQYYTYSHHSDMNVYVTVDPASEKKDSADYTVMCVIGLASDNNYYLLDMIRDRLSLTERAVTLFDLHRRWKPLHVGYEKYGIQADTEYLRECMNRQNYHFHVIELGGRLAKIDRIKKLVPYFEQKRIFFPANLHKTNNSGKLEDLIDIFLNEEYKRFPYCAHDDMLDALARIVDDNMQTCWPYIYEENEHKDRYNKKTKRQWSQWSA